MFFSKTLVALGGALALVNAHPASHHSHKRFHEKRGAFSSSSCSNAAPGLSQAACMIMAEIGFLGMGANSGSGQMSIGDHGPNTFKFTNGGNDEATVVGWTMTPGSYVSMDMNVSPAAITYTLKKGESVTISLANGVSGSFTGLYSDTKMVNGQVSETWLEFTTGPWATIDVSREINMAGRSISAVVKDSGCKSDMDTCVFKCNSGNICGEAGTYSLHACSAGSQTGASDGKDGNGQASGGCMGFNNGGHIDVVLNGNGGSIPAPESSPSPPPAPPSSTPQPSPTPPPAPSPVKMLQVVSTSTTPSSTPVPTPTHNPMAVVALPGDKTLHEFSEAVYRAVGAGSKKAP